MKQLITLERYLNMGGLLCNVDWIEAVPTYGDENLDNRIIGYEDPGEMNGEIKLINFKFPDGKIKRYAASWIKVNVDLVLNEKYTKK